MLGGLSSKLLDDALQDREMVSMWQRAFHLVDEVPAHLFRIALEQHCQRKYGDDGERLLLCVGALLFMVNEDGVVKARNVGHMIKMFGSLSGGRRGDLLQKCAELGQKNWFRGNGAISDLVCVRKDSGVGEFAVSLFRNALQIAIVCSASTQNDRSHTVLAYSLEPDRLPPGESVVQYVESIAKTLHIRPGLVSGRGEVPVGLMHVHCVCLLRLWAHACILFVCAYISSRTHSH
eukprot:TRINITY_DN7196_c0_g1_i2.p1 TRINITY_DN7196_c0_g1~~TRINITY_DN7196_c0_g1_i2.p1  ORF type:complete len:234 (-),score=2.68 TRINITY_DN7196_c0_g1_i2:634-1335(-)